MASILPKAKLRLWPSPLFERDEEEAVLNGVIIISLFSHLIMGAMVKMSEEVIIERREGDKK